MTQREVARALGVCRQRVTQLEAMALAKLAGTEAELLAPLAAKERARRRRKAAHAE
jgi:DNA-directed RNA polymerase sigma subunit (sigma70/sigma32)